jgi:Na+/proline symporter
MAPLAGITFIIGLIAAAYSSADSAMTALTTSFTVDILGITRRSNWKENKRIRFRYFVHFCIAIVIILVIIGFRAINDQSVISMLFTLAGYTYGPLLGIYAFGLFTRFKVKDHLVPFLAILSPALCYVISVLDKQLLYGYNFGFELLILNGLITFAGLLIIRRK